MQEFHEGQEIMALRMIGGNNRREWHKAKILNYHAFLHGSHEPDQYLVQFNNGSRSRLTTNDIKTIK